MSTQAVRFFIVMLLLAAGGGVRAADSNSTATDAEKSYLALRNSKDAKSQLLAERWYGLVKLREWDDTSGKFKTTAKYVEQDDKAGTVKLRVIKGFGSDQSVEDKTISVDKLSKECQSRVKQIAFLAEKVSDAEKAEAEKPKDGSDAAMGGMGPQMMDDRNPHSPKPKPDRPGAKSKAKAAAADQAEHPATEAPSAALPAAMTELPVVAAATPDPRAAAAERDARAMTSTAAPANPAASDARGEPRPALPANLPDGQPWRTSFAAFVAQLKPERTETGWQLSWGDLAALKQAHDEAIAMATGPRGRDFAASPPSYDALGDVSWEATLSQQPDVQTDWTKALGLNLPEPFKLSCELDNERGAGDWRRFFPGDHVKFVGRFVGFEGDGGMHLSIRFPNDAPVAIPDRSAERR